MAALMFVRKRRSVSYTTWNSADKDSTIALSGSDLIATQSGAGTYGGVRSVASKSAGKFYWEYTLTTAGAETYLGVAKSAASLTGYLGSDAHGWGWYHAGGQMYNNGAVIDTESTLANGDVIGVAMDVDAGKLWFRKNGTYQNSGDPA